VLGEYALTLGNVSNTYTVTAASPAEITAANPAVFTTEFQLANNVQVTLSTTGTLPFPFDTTTTYYVVNTSGYTFQLSLTSGGSAISTVGSSQSGVQTVTAKASSTAAAGGGTVRAAYQINVGPSYAVSLNGWGVSTWGSGAWGVGVTGVDQLRLWTQSNFGEDLIFGPRNSSIYYWDAVAGLIGTTFTVTIAMPAVLSTSITLVNGMAIYLTTDGALPTGLNVGNYLFGCCADCCIS